MFKSCREVGFSHLDLRGGVKGGALFQRWPRAGAIESNAEAFSKSLLVAFEAIAVNAICNCNWRWFVGVGLDSKTCISTLDEVTIEDQVCVVLCCVVLF